MGKGSDRYVFSYEALGEPEADTGVRDAEDQAAAEFLEKVSDLVFKGAAGDRADAPGHCRPDVRLPGGAGG